MHEQLRIRGSERRHFLVFLDNVCQYRLYTIILMSQLPKVNEIKEEALAVLCSGKSTEI